MAEKTACPTCGKVTYSFLHSCPGIPQRPVTDNTDTETLAEVRLTDAEREAIGERICWNCHDRNVWAEVERILADRIEQARAGETALRERVEALLGGWLAVHANPDEDAEELGLYGEAYRECAADLRAALDTTGGTP